MKLPALAIATAFALGIACGLNPEIVHRSSSHAFIAFLLCGAATSLLIGIVLAVRLRLVIAGLGSLLCWGMLGVAAVCIQEQPRRVDHILTLVDAGIINLKSPLRYYGRLADEPEKLPWGNGYDIELSGVDYEGLFVPASGGLRLGYIARTDHGAPVAVHTGDSIAVLTRAKLPQVFRDEGAFDRQAYLSQEGVDLVGALRAPELKVGHHGSKNSTTQEFLDAVAPTIATISPGEDNPYGHPSPELLERLEPSGARVLRTDQDGAVHIVTDGERLEISCFVACAELASITTSKRAEAPN